MSTWWIAVVLGFVSGGIGILAQPPADSDTNEPSTVVTSPNLELPTLRSLVSFDRSLPATDLANALSRRSSTLATSGIDGKTVIPDSDLLKIFTIESFGYGRNTPQEFAFSPGYFAALFNLQGLECPRCVLGPVTRSRFTLPPFGAIANLRLRDYRIELFAGFSGIEAWKPDGTFEPRGRSLWTNSYGDAWLTQTQAGVRLAFDRDRRISVGATGRHLYNFGSGPQQWSTFSGDIMFKLGH
jgi:hypothetical protein